MTADGADPDASSEVEPSVSGSTGRARRSRVVIGVLALAAGAILAIVLHGSIGSGSRKPLRSRIDAVLSVMRATSVQVRVVQTTAQADPKSETVVGVVDLRRGRSRYTVALFYGPQGQRLHPPGTAQFISVGRSVYADVLPDPTIPADAQRNKHWIEQTVPSGYDPTGVLGDLTSMRDSHASRDLGTTELDGHLVHHYQAVFHPAAKTATTRLLSLRASVSDVYIDAENQVVRLVERDTLGTDTSTRQSDFSNYGIHIDIVVPPADQVILYTDEYPPAPHLTGAWNLAASGHTDGVAWHLYRAPADHERACWTFESTPPLDIGPLVANFNGPALRHDGHEATCSRSGVWAAPLQYLVFGAPPHQLDAILVAVVNDNVTAVTKRSNRDGSNTGPVAIDAHFRGFVIEATTEAYTLHLHNRSSIICHSTDAGDNAETATPCGLAR